MRVLRIANANGCNVYKPTIAIPTGRIRIASATGPTLAAPDSEHAGTLAGIHFVTARLDAVIPDGMIERVAATPFSLHGGLTMPHTPTPATLVPTPGDAYLREVAAGMTPREASLFLGFFVRANFPDAEDAALTVGFGLGLTPAILPACL
jgi:hypothetical protein